MAKVASRILGPDGQPIEYDVLTEEISAATMTGIRQVWHTGVAAGLTPARLASILSSAAEGNAHEYLTLAEEMEERDLHYASVLGTRKLALSGLDIRIDAASDDAADVKIADALREVVSADEFGDSVADLTDALGKGYAAAEIVWDRSGRVWTPERIEHRDPRFFQFDRTTGRTLRLLDDQEPVNGIALPPYKFVIHLPRIRSGLPIRGGLARLAAVGYMCKAWSWKDWMAFADVFGMPLRVGRYGPNAKPEDISRLIAAVANLGSDAAAVMPDTTRIEFEAAPNTAGAADFFERLASWWDKQISKGVLGQTMTSDDGASRSQAEVHDRVRGDLRRADAKALQNTLNRDLVRPFVDLNFGPGRYPKLVVHVPDHEGTQRLVESLVKLVPLGLTVEQSIIRDRLGLPDPDAGADVLRQAQPAPAFPALNRARNAEELPPQPTAASGNAAAGDAVVLAVDALSRQAAPTIDAWIGELRDVVDAAASLDEIRDRLIDRYASLPVTALARQIAQAMAVVMLAGRADIQRLFDDDRAGVASATNAEQPGAGIIDRGWKPAADFFAQKVNLPTSRWDDLWQGQHARAFVVAGATRDALLSDLRNAVESAIAGGTSYDTFRREFEDIVARHGWTGWTGEGSDAGRDWRARTIYQTNLSAARAAGRYQQMTDPDVLAHMPYWQYRHNTVANPREAHLALNGIVLRWDDPWWRTHYPPNGWGCQCDVRPLSERQLRRMGKTGPDTAPPPGEGDPPPEWAYNVGQAAWGQPVAAATIAAERGGTMVALDPRGPADFGRPPRVPLDAPVAAPIARTRDAAGLRAAFRDAIGGDSAIFTDPAGGRINVTSALIDHWLADPDKRMQGREQYLPLLREVIEQPFEVWVGFARNEATGRVELRRRYVKAVDLGGGRVLGLIAEAVGGQWIGFNFFSGRPSGAARLRAGMLLWGRGGA